MAAWISSSVAPTILSVDGRRRLNRIGTGVEIDRCQERVNKRAEAPSAWPLDVAALHPLDVNVRARPRGLLYFGLTASRKPSVAAARASEVTVWTDSDG